MKRTEADKRAYTIAQENELAKIAQQKALDENRAQTEAEVAKTVAEQKQIAEAADIARARAVEVASIEKARDLALSEQDKKIKLAEKTEAEAAATAKANLAKAEAVKAEEQVETARKTEIANRDKAIAVIKAEQEAEQEAVGVRVTAQAEKQAAEDRAAAIVQQAQAEKDRDTLRAEGILAVGTAEAEALERRNAAENNLTEAAANLRLRLALTKELASIVTASVKPLEKIDSIRIVDLDGFAPGGNGQAGAEGSAETADRVVNAALRHRAVAPLIDNVMAEVGLLGGLNGLATGKSDILANLTPTAGAPKIASEVSEILTQGK
jgi:uncharacterized membrane protein YqiK